MPFFRHAYTKIRQTGAFHRHSKKWRTEDQSIGCDSNIVLTPISFNKIVSLVAVLLLGIFLALITLVFENMYLQKKTTKRMEWNIDKVEEEEGNSQGRNELKIEQGSLKQKDRIPLLDINERSQPTKSFLLCETFI